MFPPEVERWDVVPICLRWVRYLFAGTRSCCTQPQHDRRRWSPMIHSLLPSMILPTVSSPRSRPLPGCFYRRCERRLLHSSSSLWTKKSCGVPPEREPRPVKEKQTAWTEELLLRAGCSCHGSLMTRRYTHQGHGRVRELHGPSCVLSGHVAGVGQNGDASGFSPSIHGRPSCSLKDLKRGDEKVTPGWEDLQPRTFARHAIQDHTSILVSIAE